MYVDYKELFKSLFLVALLGALAFVTVTCGSGEEEILCGNGAIDIGETCDGNDVGGWTCADIPALGKYADGFLGCTAQCVLETSACDSCWGYPCEPEDGYGSAVGEVIEDLTYPASNNAAQEYGFSNSTPEEFALSYVYKQGISKGGHWKGALIFITTGWCPYCRYEAQLLEESYQYYKNKGIMFIAVIAQDATGAAATKEYAQQHADSYGWTFPAIHGEFPMKFWPNQVGYPLNMIVDFQDMKIVKADSGALMNRDLIDAYLGDVLNDESE